MRAFQRHPPAGWHVGVWAPALALLLACGGADDAGGPGGSGDPGGSGPPPGEALRLVITAFPAQASRGLALSPEPSVEVRTAAGGLYAPPVEVTLEVTDGGGVVSGTSTVVTREGSARFAGLAIDGLGRQQVRFTAAGIPVAATAVVTLGVPPLVARAFTGVTLVPMDAERTVPGQTVLVVDGRIAALGADGGVPLPPGTVTIDGAGKYLMPGLVDGHTHERPLASWPDDVAGNFIMMLANGITSHISMGDFTRWPVVDRDRVRSRQIAGPEGYLGHFARGQAEGGPSFTVPRTPAEGRQLVQQVRATGYDFVKVYSGLAPEVFNAIAGESRTLGLAIGGHRVNSVGVPAAIDAGQRLVVHALDLVPDYFPTLDPAAIPGVAATFAARGIWVSPTLYVTEVIRDLGLEARAGRDPWAFVLSRPGTEYMDDRALPAWQSMLAFRTDITSGPDRRALVAFLSLVVRGFANAGVPMFLGTDEIGIPGVVPGFAMQGELTAMLGAGLTPYEVLSLATRLPGRFIREELRSDDRVGTIEVGARADLLLLDDNPLQGLVTLHAPAGVMAAGQWYDGAFLRRQLAWLRSAR